jgi:hypothetical protein
MTGRIRRQLLAERLQTPQEQPALMCPLCERVIPQTQKDAHHLVPKSKGGRHTEFLHRMCHRQVHALFTETELARQYSTVEALLARPEMARFVAWVRGKPVDFYERTLKSQRVRGR